MRCPENGGAATGCWRESRAALQAPGGPGRLCTPTDGFSLGLGLGRAGSSACVFAGRVFEKRESTLMSARELGGTVHGSAGVRQRPPACVSACTTVTVGGHVLSARRQAARLPGPSRLHRAPHTAHCWPCAFMQISPGRLGPPCWADGLGDLWGGRGPSGRDEAAQLSVLRGHTARLRLLGPCMSRLMACFSKMEVPFCSSRGPQAALRSAQRPCWVAFRHLAASWAECRARSSSLPSWGPARALGGLSLTSGNHLLRSCWVTDASCCAGSAAVHFLVESAWAWRWHLRAPCLWLCDCPGQSGPSGASLRPLRSCPRAPLEDHSPSPLCGHRPGLQPSYPFWSRPPLGTLDLPQGCPPAQGQLCCTPDSRLGAPQGVGPAGPRWGGHT